MNTRMLFAATVIMLLLQGAVPALSVVAAMGAYAVCRGHK